MALKCTERLILRGKIFHFRAQNRYCTLGNGLLLVRNLLCVLQIGIFFFSFIFLCFVFVLFVGHVCLNLNFGQIGQNFPQVYTWFYNYRYKFKTYWIRCAKLFQPKICWGAALHLSWNNLKWALFLNNRLIRMLLRGNSTPSF